jgi:hypothetical protein
MVSLEVDILSKIRQDLCNNVLDFRYFEMFGRSTQYKCGEDCNIEELHV